MTISHSLIEGYYKPGIEAILEQQTPEYCTSPCALADNATDEHFSSLHDWPPG